MIQVKIRGTESICAQECIIAEVAFSRSKLWLNRVNRNTASEMRRTNPMDKTIKIPGSICYPTAFRIFRLLRPSYLFVALFVVRRETGEVREIGKIASGYFGASENTKRFNASAAGVMADNMFPKAFSDIDLLDRLVTDPAQHSPHQP